MAFGTGVHETTQLCLEALEEFRRPGMAVLDVGTGSGILARAARLLAPGPVYACDIDPVAVEIARDGFVGSVDAVAANSVDLVVANINPPAIVQLAPEFLRVLRPGGVLLASGFEIDEVAQVQAALPPGSRRPAEGQLGAAGYLTRLLTAAPIRARSWLVCTISKRLPCSGLILTMSCKYWVTSPMSTKSAFGPAR